MNLKYFSKRFFSLLAPALSYRQILSLVVKGADESRQPQELSTLVITYVLFKLLKAKNCQNVSTKKHLRLLDSFSGFTQKYCKSCLLIN